MIILNIMIEAKVLKIVFCGPGDVGTELNIAAKVIQSWNLENFDRLNCGLQLSNWKTDAVPTMGERGQAVINDQLIDQSDLMVAVFWRRFGTPTGMHDSGTAEEVQRAMARDIPVMLYFSDIEAPTVETDAGQNERLNEFRQRAMGSGLPWSFRSRKEFEDAFKNHLDFKVREMIFESNKAALTEPVHSITQTVNGEGNVALVGDSNQINFNSSSPKQPKIVMEYGDKYLSPTQQQEVSELVRELAALIEDVEHKTTRQAMAETWSRLKNQFKVAKYDLLTPEQLPEVHEWFLVNKRKLLSSSRRKAPLVHKRARIPAIKAAMGRMRRTNENYYPEIAIRLKMKSFVSLKKLKANDLERVYSLVKRDEREFE